MLLFHQNHLRISHVHPAAIDTQYTVSSILSGEEVNHKSRLYFDIREIPYHLLNILAN